ncbi:reverse transcriptase [Cucumis melo var. makuwa]|uniref:Reverse transcriptase n=1 Tax=Cucumis melo var. makuwa TaxID=1194695 RepID=A0A5A7TPH3_CUCMM|nr:reverse transcriptase [Cucumis melo var. makuwa]
MSNGARWRTENGVKPGWILRRLNIEIDGRRSGRPADEDRRNAYRIKTTRSERRLWLEVGDRDVLRLCLEGGGGSGSTLTGFHRDRLARTNKLAQLRRSGSAQRKRGSRMSGGGGERGGRIGSAGGGLNSNLDTWVHALSSVNLTAHPIRFYTLSPVQLSHPSNHPPPHGHPSPSDSNLQNCQICTAVQICSSTLYSNLSSIETGLTNTITDRELKRIDLPMYSKNPIILLPNVPSNYITNFVAFSAQSLIHDNGKPILVCEHCRKQRHTKDQCWKLHGWFPRGMSQSLGLISVDGTNPWILDLGDIDHLTGFSEHFVSYTPYAGNEKIQIADGFLAPIAGKGQIVLFNGLSLIMFCMCLSFLTIYYLSDLNLGRTINTARHRRRLYILNDDTSGSSISTTSLPSSYFSTYEHDFMLWHFRDVWGPSKVTTSSGKRWFVTFIDDHTRLTWVYLITDKSEEESHKGSRVLYQLAVGSSPRLQTSSISRSDVAVLKNVEEKKNGDETKARTETSNNEAEQGHTGKLDKYDPSLDLPIALRKEICALPKRHKPVGCKWVFTLKYKADGTLDKYKLDVKNAFWNGDLVEEVYMSPPPGFEAQFGQQSQGYSQGHSDHTLFTKVFETGKIGVLIVYVDDIVLSGDDNSEINQLKQRMRNSDDQVQVDKEQYQRLVGKLIYLSHTCPDISFAVSAISQFMHAPYEEHMKAVKRILRYLKTTPGKGLMFRKTDKKTIEAYTDSGWVGSIVDRKSTSGCCTFVWENLVTWRNKKQSVVVGAVLRPNIDL